jgi:DegV family protein with EDD domain
LSNEEFYERLTAPGAPMPRTAAPNPARFEAAFGDALDSAADAVVCVTISARLSSTYASAVQAAGAFDKGVVQVIDSRTVTQALGLIVLEAAELARTGAEQAAVVDRVVDLAGRTEIYFTLHTLEFLQRGGRIGRASALVGSMLEIKPILHVLDGEVAPFDRKRTFAKARARVIEIASAGLIERVAVLHTQAADLDAFHEQVAAATGIEPGLIDISLTGPVAGAHVGPGMIGISRILAD